MNTTDQPTPEPGWRMLDVGEVIQEGDEWLYLEDNYEEWEKVDLLIGFKLLRSQAPCRRRLPSQPETPSGPPDALPPKDEAQGETGTNINPDCRETTLEGWRLWCLEAERERDEASQTVSKYATAARVIALHLKAFCDEALPYDEMIADAARKAASALAAAEGDASNWADRHEHVYQQLLTSQSKLAKLQSALNGVLAETKEKLVECGYNPLVVEDFDSFVNSRAALDELKALKAKPLPVPQTPQEHIEDVMKVGFNRGCG